MKKPARTWGVFIVFGSMFFTVGISAMVISFTTLMDVAATAGLPHPVMFPIVIDVGMTGAMLVASQMKIRQISGRWLAYTMFIYLSGMSIAANTIHALMTEGMTLVPLWVALIAATPPITLLGFTELMMRMLPDEKERQKLSQLREKQAATLAPKPAPQPVKPQTQTAAAVVARTGQVAGLDAAVKPSLELVPAEPVAVDAVEKLVQEWIAEHGEKPTGRLVGEWLGNKSAKTGQRFLAKLDLGEDNDAEALMAAVGGRA